MTDEARRRSATGAPSSPRSRAELDELTDRELEVLALAAEGLSNDQIAARLYYMERNLVAGLFHAAASLGVAESADAVARRGLNGRINGDGRPRMQVADNAVDLTAARGVLSRAAALIDERLDATSRMAPGPDELTRLFAEAQAAKAFVGEAAARIVDRALALSGGAGYLNGSVLARAYRDVRAGAFMHPLGSNRLYDYLARVVLGEPSPLH